MRDSAIINSYIKQLFSEFSNTNQENSPCHAIENVSIIVNKKRWNKRKNNNLFEHAQQPSIAFRLSRHSKPNKQAIITRHSSMPQLSKCTRPVPPRNRSGRGNDTKQSQFQSKFIANVVSEHRFDNWFCNSFSYPSQTKWKIYRCQLGAVEDSCCCSCNSDAMFEVMKGLYDCYKAKNCDDCDCVLCGYKTREEKKLDELKKSMTSTARERVLDGKTPPEKEFILKEMAQTGVPLPSGKTASEKSLINKVRKELGLPPSPKNASEKSKMRKAEAAGIIIPLEGKSPEEKERILKAQADMGLPLPEGRTDSEKALIEKIKKRKKPSMKTAALLTPITGKTPEEKEKILRGRAQKGLPLPEATTPSEKKLIDKVRVELGLPMEPTTKSMKKKYEQAAKAGILQPLEGKTPEEKEKILQGQYDLGIPLPEGRTPSEKALIAKIKARSIKTAGIMTPLAGKPPALKEKILRKRAMKGIPLPEGQTPSEKKLVDKVRADLGLPKEPDTKSMKKKHEQAARAGLLEPLEGKTAAQKEQQLKGLRDMGIPLPEGRTPSEKALIAKVKGAPRSIVTPSEQMRRAKAEGLLTPLTGKTPAQKEKILKGLAMKGIPLPEGKTESEKKIIDKVRDDLGLPKAPDTKSMKVKHEQAAKAGLLQPLVGKTPEEKEKILQGQYDLGIPLPEGRTPSEKALIAKIKALSPGSIKTAGVMTPLAGKPPAFKEKVLRARAMKGIPLPEGETPSEKKLIDKVRADLGLPKEPDTKSMKKKHEQAARAGYLEPLEGKTAAQKEQQLKGLRDMGIPLPEGRTPSEKALIAKIKAAPRSIVAPSEQMRRAKAEGLLTPLTGKTPAQKEKILKGLAMKGIPLPEGKTASEKKIIDKVRDDLGLPKEPDTKSMRDKHEQAAKAGLLQPLVGKTPEEKEKILQGQYDLGIPLPEGRTPSEKALIAKIKARPPGSIKTAGVMTPLAGKPPALKEKVLRARAMKGIPLPEGETPSEKKLIEKVRADLGLPKEPDTKSMKKKHEQAARAGLLEPLEGKTAAQKEQQLKGLRDMGIPLPEGRTPSEKALIAKIKAAPRSIVAPSEQMRRAKAEGLLTPLTGKTPAQKEKILKGLAMKGIPLPEGKTESEKKILDKVRDDLGLPKEPDTKSMRDKHEQAAKAGLLQPLVGKTPEEKEKILQGQYDLGIPLPEGRTPSEKALIAKIKARPPGSIKTAGVMTPLAGKPPALKEKVLRARAMKGIPLPEGETPSEKKLIEKVRADLGLPKEPDTKSMKKKHEQAARAGLLEPLEGKTAAQKEQQLKGLRDMGIPLPEGRTPSEKALIAKIKAAPRSIVAPSEQMRRAKAEGLLTPLTGKTPAQKEKILKGLAMKGIPLPEGKTESEKKIIDKVRDDLGLPKEPDTKSMREKHEQAAKAGFLQPLVGKTPEEKENILQGQYDLGIPLPEGRTPSEKALIAKIKARPPGSIKTAGVMTPLAGKPPALKEKVLRARAMKGIPLPEGETPSEKKIIAKVRADLGLPKEPDTKSMKLKHEQAARAGLLEPLEGKTAAQKEQQLKGLRDMGIPLPEGRTPSEKALIAKIKAAPRSIVAPSEQMRRAKAEGLLTPLTGKTRAQKEKILKGLAMKGIPLPEGKTESEKKIIDKVRDDLGLPKEPDTKSMREKHERAAKAGLLQPLVGKTPEEKEKILQGQYDLGIPLPEGRTPSEKALIAKIKARPPGSIKTAGVMTPLAGKPPALKEKVLRARAMKGIPLPEGETPSEKKLIEKVRADLGLPKEPDTKSMKKKHEQAARAGLLEPLEGKTAAQKEQQLKGLRDMGIPLPEGRTPSEKALIAKIKAAPRSIVAPSEQMRRAKAEGLLTPLTGKTRAQKEKILKGLAMKGIPLPEGKTESEKKIIDKVRDDLGLPKEPDTKSMKEKHEQAAKAGLLQPLVGKTPEEKENILQGQYDLGIPLPEGRTPSEKAIIAKIKARPPGSIKTAGVMTPLAGKPPALKEKVLRARAMKGIPLPEGETPSEKKLIEKVRADLGLPKEPDTKSMKKKHEQAARAGLLEPLEGKTAAQKEQQLKGLRDMGIPLPEGRTPSEKALIAKIKAAPRSIVAPSEQMRRAKAEGLLTPLTGKTRAQKEKILKGLAMKGIPLPEGKTASEKKIIDKVRDDLGLPKEPDTKSMKEKHEQAAKAGLLQPLVGKTPEEKENILQGQYDLGIPLPEGRTPSEKALIAKIKARPPGSIKTAGVMTPLAGKPPALKEKVLRARAMKGIPLPEGETPSEKKLIEKVRADLGLPKEPDTKSMKKKHEQAARAGLLEPLEGKTAAQKEQQLKGLRDMGIPLPEGRTPSEKALIAKIKAAPRSIVAPSEQMRRAKAEGLLTPLTGKTRAQKEKILKGLAMKGIPLPEGKTESEKKIIDKVRDDLGLPKEPDTKSMRDKHEQAAKAGLLQPLVGKTPEEKEKILQGQYDLGIPLPEGRTPSEKAIIAKIKARPPGSIKTAGVMTPLAGKPPALKEKVLRARAMKGIPLPEGETPSEKKLIDKVRADLGLPKEPDTKSMKLKHEQAARAGYLEPLEGKTAAQKEQQLKGLRDMGIPLPEGRTPSEKALIAKIKAAPRSIVAPSEQMRRAKAEGLLTPLTGKTRAQKEKILKGLAMKGLPLPEGKTASEKKIIDKVRDDLGLPKEPDTKSMKEKHEQAAKAGLLQPLVGKTPEEKENILQGQYDLGIPLPEGRTPSEKAIIAKIKARPPGSIKTAGVMTPLAGKPPALKEKVLRARAMKGIPLPEGETPSEKKIIEKVRADLGLPKEPDTKSMKKKHEQAARAGLLEPLEGKTAAQKEQQLKGLRDMGIPLPEGRTPSEKALIAKIKAAPRSIVAPSEQMRRAKAEGLLTPLTGKTPAQKEKILKGLAMKGIPLPEGKTASEKKIIDKVRDDLGLPKEPDTKSMKEKHEQAAKAGLLQPLVGKTPEEKEKILQGQYDLGIPLPEGRTPSEKAIIAKIKARPPGSIKTAGVMTPLAGKPPALKEKVLRARAMKGIPLPEGETPSEKKLIDKVRADLGLPKEPDTKSMKKKHEQAARAGYLEPLEGKTAAQKEQQLKGLRDMGIPLPEGRTPSEKALIAKIKAAPRSIVVPSEQMRRAKAEGLLTPLTGKTRAQKEKILKGLAMKGIPLPEGKTASEKKIIDKVRDDLGLPKEPDTKSMRDKHEQAAKAGLLQPLVGKTPEEKEKILQGQYDLGIPLPEGRTPSEKAIIAKIKARPPGSIKTAGVMMPLAGKPPALKEKVLRARAMKGIPLPEGETPSEKKLIEKVRADLGLPKEPDTKSMKLKHEQAARAGYLEPLEGKTAAQKEQQLKGLRDMGIPLPEGRTPSEKALIAKIKAAPRSIVAPSEQMRRAKAEGLLTPLTGKTRAQKEKILKGLAMKGIPLPEGKTASEKKIIDKVRDDLGLPKEPDTKSMKEKHEQAAKAGLLQPLVGKTPEEKENILQGQYDLGIPLPEGRTPSEKAIIAKIKARPPGSIKTAGVMTPLAGKPPALKEKVLRARAMKGIPLPEGETPSEKKLIEKVRADLGLPKEPDTKSMKKKHEQAARAGLLEPLEGKTAAQKEQQLKGLRDMGIPLPEGRTPSEKALIAKIKAAPRSIVAPSEQMRRAKAEGLLTPLTGKTPAQKEKILKGLAMKGIPLPEGKTASEKKIIDKVRDDLGLPKEPDTKSMRDKHEQAAKAGFLQPLVGKTPEEKEKILKGLRDYGIPLPEGRTPSEKALVAKVKAAPRSVVAPSEQMRRAKAEGLLTPLKGKTPEQKEKILRGLAMKGLPLPEPQTPSEKKLADKVRAELGLTKEPTTKSLKEKHEKAAEAGLLRPLEGLTPEEKEKTLKGLQDLGIPLPEGRTPSEKALISKVKSLRSEATIKTADIMMPLAGKTPEQKEKVLRARAMKGIPLPEGETPSEKKLLDKVRADLGLPKEPDTKSMKVRHEQAAKAGLLEPLEGKTPAQKEQQLKGLRDMGIPLPEGRTPSEKALIAKVKASPRSVVAPSEQMRRAKAEGLLTPLTGKTPAQKEKILKGLAMKGIPLPEGVTPSEKKLVDKVRADLGLPKEPDTKSMRDKHEQAAKAGLLQPLVGKTPEEKEKILKGLRDYGIPLPEGRTPSEKALIAKVKAAPRSVVAPSEQMRRAKAEGLLTPLKGKTPEQKEKILRGLAMKGLPLPEPQTPSEKKLADKVRADLGLTKEPTTKSLKEKHEKAAKAGLLRPLEGLTPEEKEKTLKGLQDLGIPLPEGRTPSEKALISKVKSLPREATIKTADVMMPLAGKTPEQKEKILRARAMKGIPLPVGETPSEKKLVDKVRADLGLPKEPDTKSMKDKHEQAAKAGLLEPLEGKTPAQKEQQLKGLRDMGIPLPEGRTPSEKALIAKVKASPRSVVAPSEQMRRAKAEGLLTPLTGKTPAQKEKILKGLAMKGIPLPEGVTPSEKKLVDKVRADLGLPKEPDTKSMRDKHEQAAKAGLLQPLVGKTPEEKEKILKGLRDYGIPLPEGRTPSEKALIAKVKAAPRSVVAPSEQMRRAKAEGLLTPLKGKTPEQKEKILRGLAMKGLPLPEPQTPSEKKLADKVRADLGLTKEPTTKSLKEKHEKAAKAGLLRPLEGLTPEEKEKTLKGLQDLGIPLPEGRTPSEKALVAKVKASAKEPTITSDKLRKAKAAGLLTPLAGKTPEEKEKILQGLAQIGLPLPEGKTPSEIALVNKVKNEFGIPERTLSEKMRRAKTTGLLTPLEGKSPEQKEKILRGRAAAGLPLPMAKTPSERDLIKKIKDETGYVTPAPSEGLRRAKAAGLMTPLEGKTPAQKEKILKGLAEAGLPLPEGKTKSEKSMIAKIKARTPPLGITPSEKSIIGRAKAAGLFTPITGKSPAEKERILKGLAEAGLPLPEGKTASEKELVKKIRAEAGLPPEPTPSEKKGKIRKKEKKVGISASKKARGIDAEEFEDIIKTTTCDRGCGCDKKKIRFKHSYVKIRVTSPDISSFCDCPGECFPGVKSGAFIDNDGIKVTIGSALGIPSYSMVCINQVIPDEIISNTDLSKTHTNYYNIVDVFKKSKYMLSSFESGLNINNSNKENDKINVSSSDISYKQPYNIQSENSHEHSSISKSKRIVESLRQLQSLHDIYKEPTTKSKSSNSVDTILIISNEMLLSTSTSNSMDTISLTSVMLTSVTSSSALYSGYQSTNDLLSSTTNSLDGLTTSDDFINYSAMRERKAITNIEAAIPLRYTIIRMSELEDNFGNKNLKESMKDSETEDPIVLFNQLPSKLDVSKTIFEIMSKKRFSTASSVFIVVPMSEDEEEQVSSNCVDSTTSMRSSECDFTANTSSHVDPGV